MSNGNSQQPQTVSFCQERHRSLDRDLQLLWKINLGILFLLFTNLGGIAVLIAKGTCS